MPEKTLKQQYIDDVIELKKSLDYFQAFLSEKPDEDMFKNGIAAVLNSLNTDIKLLNRRIKPNSK
ncbi:MAG: hypothetical protein WC979_02965 [Candidatus Pacearchaeota archaeon]|jgi:hypothetical protein|nr:hypothetical protein [Clostridia bacterium]